MELKDTIEMMNSGNYEDRFKAEYYQLKIRTDRLKNILDEWENGRLHFVPTCQKETLSEQLRIMTAYMAILDSRAGQEEIRL